MIESSPFLFFLLLCLHLVVMRSYFSLLALLYFLKTVQLSKQKFRSVKHFLLPRVTQNSPSSRIDDLRVAFVSLSFRSSFLYLVYHPHPLSRDQLCPSPSQLATRESCRDRAGQTKAKIRKRISFLWMISAEGREKNRRARRYARMMALISISACMMRECREPAGTSFRQKRRW